MRTPCSMPHTYTHPNPAFLKDSFFVSRKLLSGDLDSHSLHDTIALRTFADSARIRVIAIRVASRVGRGSDRDFILPAFAEFKVRIIRPSLVSSMHRLGRCAIRLLRFVRGVLRLTRGPECCEVEEAWGDMGKERF